MPRLFYGNFDFEHQLADPHRQTSARLNRLNAELATSWLALADDGDLIWTPLSIDPDFIPAAVAQGLPRVILVTSFSNLPQNVELIPWGWSPEARRLASRLNIRCQPPTDEAIRLANSRATSERLERQWNVGLTGTSRIQSLSQLDNAIRGLENEQSWVVKAEFGMSGRERILGCGPASPAAQQWLTRRLDLYGFAFFEPWVQRVAELGIQIDIPQVGTPRLVGLTPMRVDRRGQYAGSYFTYSSSTSTEITSPTETQPDSSEWQSAVDVALKAADYLQSQGYFGPLGLDAMQYRDTSGGLQIRPLQDINARWTMGRLSLGWQRFASSEDQGLWSHARDVDDTDALPFTIRRRLIISPQKIGNETCNHSSRVLIGPTRTMN